MNICIYVCVCAHITAHFNSHLRFHHLAHCKRHMTSGKVFRMSDKRNLCHDLGYIKLRPCMLSININVVKHFLNCAQQSRKWDSFIQTIAKVSV